MALAKNIEAISAIWLPVLDLLPKIARLNTNEYKKFNAIKLACYWYFRKPTYQATTIEDSPLMVKNNQLNRQSFFDYAERQGIYEQIDGQKKKMVLGVDKKPMVHH